MDRDGDYKVLPMSGPGSGRRLDSTRCARELLNAGEGARAPTGGETWNLKFEKRT